jgi:hypothetical protein
MLNRILVIALIAGLLFSAGCAKKAGQNADVKSLQKAVKEQASKVEKEYGLRLAEGVLCTGVENRKPAGKAESFTTDSQLDVYFFTRITGNPSTKVFHRFSRLVNGGEGMFWKEQYRKELAVESTNYRTWTFKTVFPGFWRADLLGPDGNDIMKSIVFEVKGPAVKPVEVPVNTSAKASDLTLLESATCADVKDLAPVSPGESFSLESGKDLYPVWAWMHVKAATVPSVVYLRWSGKQTALDGTVNWVAEMVQKLDIKGKDWKTYSWRNCPEGVSRLDIIGPDGKTVLKTVDVTVTK